MENLPISPGQRRVLAAGLVVVGALALAVKLTAGAGAPDEPARAEPLRASPPAPPPPMLVHVVGAVRRAGLYRLAEGSRVADAVARAGGATRKADLTLLNLAAPVADGAQVVVPARLAAASRSAATPPGAPPGPVHLNTATAEDLDALPGVGPVTAQKIVAYRDQNGSFRSVEDLDAVPGIGPARLEELRPLVAP